MREREREITSGTFESIRLSKASLSQSQFKRVEKQNKSKGKLFPIILLYRKNFPYNTNNIH